MSFDREGLVSILEGIAALPEVEVSILYSRGGIPVLMVPSMYNDAYLLKQMGFVIRSEWSVRDIFSDPDRWRTVSRELDSYTVIVSQLSPMFLLGVVLVELTEKIEENILTSIEHIREDLFS